MKSKLLSHSLIALFVILTLGVTVWSWVLIDPNFTLINHADWTQFRAIAISIGYFQRQWSANVYVTLILLLSIVSYGIVRWYKGPIVPLLIFIGIVAGLCSYPALSHDLFNYIFDARILTHYHVNPYLYKALDFPGDSMLRFMHWVHRTYPYGPTYLLISLIPSALGLGIFSMTFFLFKAMHVIFFIIAGWLLSKHERTTALLFITSPLIIVEGLINSHNDFIALSLGIVGVYVLQKRKNLFAFIVFLTSGLVKFISSPILILSIQDAVSRLIKVTPSVKDANPFHRRLLTIFSRSWVYKSVQPWHLAFGGVVTLLIYLGVKQEIHPWYFLNLFLFLPFAPKVLEKCTIFFTGLLLSYYPYVVGGEWGQGGDVGVKRKIILWGFLVNSVVLVSLWIWQSISSWRRGRNIMQ